LSNKLDYGIIEYKKKLLKIINIIINV